MWQEGVGWVGAGPRLGWNSGLGTLTFTDNPAASACLATTDGVSVNATIRMFDYTKSVNNTGNEYYFWNGDYGYGADTESTDGWGADFIWNNGKYVGANPYGSNANISLDAYHGYNRNPDVASTLSKNGYPVLIDKNPSNLGNELPLDYLFDGTYQTGSTVSGGGGLFQKDSSGYYYYDSLKNAACFNGRSFTCRWFLYK